MHQAQINPICVSPDAIIDAVKQQGYAILNANGVCQLAGCSKTDLFQLNKSWNNLSADNYLKDGGKYRSRRHSSYLLTKDKIQELPYRAHWQSLDYNALHGGMLRYFDPIEPEIASHPTLNALLSLTQVLANQIQGEQPWFTEVHQFRIDTNGGIGRPTPEGAHRDGVNFVAVFFVDRHNVKGGETRIFAVDSSIGQRFTLTDPWSLMFIADDCMIHESTPIQPIDANKIGYRDTLVITLRSNAFQGDDA